VTARWAKRQTQHHLRPRSRKATLCPPPPQARQLQRNTILELVAPEDAAAAQNDQGGSKELGRIQLPQTVPAPGTNLPSTERVAPPQANRSDEIYKIQRDIAKRRRRKLALLVSRLAFFVFLPTVLVGYYFYVLATPMFATHR